MWEAKFDPLLNQMFYISDDGSISFDLPCEVQNKTKTRGLLNRISSKLSLIRSKSNTCDGLFRKNSRPNLASVSSSETAVSPNADGAELARTTSGSYFADNLDWRRAAAVDMRLSYNQDDLSSVSSVDSIETFYSELQNEIHEEESQYGFDKECERLELRQQFIRDLY